MLQFAAYPRYVVEVRERRVFERIVLQRYDLPVQCAEVFPDITGGRFQDIANTRQYRRLEAVVALLRKKILVGGFQKVFQQIKIAQFEMYDQKRQTRRIVNIARQLRIAPVENDIEIV